MSIDPQTQSAFITCLPAEIRNAIYLELWRSAGLRQHILWHGEGNGGRHFCRWRCEAEFEVDDEGAAAAKRECETAPQRPSRRRYGEVAGT